MDTSVFSAILYEPQKYHAGVVAGFIVFPHSEDVPAGWGEPYLSEDGTPIWPGTADGPNPNRAIGYVGEDGWKMKRSKYWQVAGAIDWWGDWKNTNTKQKRYVLSWNGPVSRHWNPNNAFVYGSEPKHNDIYADGKVVACAPAPVLGAALHTWDKPTLEGGTEKETLLVVICKEGSKDVAYSRKPGGAVLAEDITDEVRAGMMALKSDQYPNGWDACGEFSPPSGAVDPEVPWFFHENGKQAKTMRRKLVDFTNEEGESKSQHTYIELIFNFTPANLTAHFTHLDVTAPTFTYTQTINKTHPTWTDLIQDQWGLYHHWQEDWLIASASISGRVKVAVDWSIEKQAWVYAWFDVSAMRRIEQYWTIGADAPSDPHSNYGEVGLGKRYPPASYPSPGDHGPDTQWFGAQEKHKILIGTDADNPDLSFYVGWGFTGTKSVAFGGKEDPGDPYLYFWDSADVYLHHLDLRSYLLAGFMRYDSILVPQDGNGVGTKYQHYYEEIEYADVDPPPIWNEDAFFYRHTSALSEFNLPFFGWDRTTMLTWNTTYNITSTVKDYQAEWSTANQGEALFKPELKSYYTGTLLTATVDPLYLRKRTLDESLLEPEKNHREGQFSSAENNTQLVAFEYMSKNTQEKEQALRLYVQGEDSGADLPTICKGGEKFHGGGTL